MANAFTSGTPRGCRHDRTVTEIIVFYKQQRYSKCWGLGLRTPAEPGAATRGSGGPELGRPHRPLFPVPLKRDIWSAYPELSGSGSFHQNHGQGGRGGSWTIAWRLGHNAADGARNALWLLLRARRCQIKQHISGTGEAASVSQRHLRPAATLHSWKRPYFRTPLLQRHCCTGTQITSNNGAPPQQHSWTHQLPFRRDLLSLLLYRVINSPASHTESRIWGHVGAVPTGSVT